MYSVFKTFTLVGIYRVLHGKRFIIHIFTFITTFCELLKFLFYLFPLFSSKKSNSKEIKCISNSSFISKFTKCVFNVNIVPISCVYRSLLFIVLNFLVFHNYDKRSFSALMAGSGHRRFIYRHLSANLSYV